MNMNAIAQTKTIGRYAVLDAALLAAACLIPAVSHLTALPLYMLNPMLALLLAGMLIGRDWRNALLLAVLLPAVSCLVVGMPTAAKMVCMMAELATVAAVFYTIKNFEFRISNFKIGVLPAVLVSIVAAKVVYYAMKALIIVPAVLVGTEWTVQLLAVMLWGGLFALLYGRGER
jgi:hypothetical protein